MVLNSLNDWTSGLLDKIIIVTPRNPDEKNVKAIKSWLDILNFDDIKKRFVFLLSKCENEKGYPLPIEESERILKETSMKIFGCDDFTKRAISNLNVSVVEGFQQYAQALNVKVLKEIVFETTKDAVRIDVKNLISKKVIL